MEQQTETINKLASGLFSSPLCKVPCVLYEAQEDLMTEVHTNVIPFWIMPPFHIFITAEIKGNYRKIETDAFRLNRLRDGKTSDVFLEALSISKGKTDSFLGMEEKYAQLFFLEEPLNKYKLEKIEVNNLGFTKEQKDLFFTLRERGITASFNHMHASAEDIEAFDLQKEQAITELGKQNLIWQHYADFERKIIAYLASTLSWLEDKKIQLEYGF